LVIAMPEERKRRNPAIDKKISDLSTDDIRVALVGTIVEKDAEISAIVIDDGENKLRAMVPLDFFENSTLGQKVRVIGIVAPALEGSEFELKGEIVQDFSKLDEALYAKYLNLK